MKSLACLRSGIVLGVWLTAVVHANPPMLIHYQGRLVDGTNLVSGTLPVEFRLYSHPTAGALFYTDSNPGVKFVDGLYNAYIGENTTFGSLDDALAYGGNVWLEIRVDGTPLVPREQLVSVPYARMVPGLRLGSVNNITLNPAATNLASGSHSVVGGGLYNQATWNFGIVAGGYSNVTDGIGATISGGMQNWSDGIASVIGGGERHEAWGSHATIGGGYQNLAGPAAAYGTVAGGRQNLAFGPSSTVAGGFQNEASFDHATVGGGRFNIAPQISLLTMAC